MQTKQEKLKARSETGADGKSIEFSVLLKELVDACTLMDVDAFVKMYNGMFPDNLVQYAGDDYFERQVCRKHKVCS